MEAVYMGLSEAAKEVIYLKKLLLDINLGKLVSNEVSVYCNNESTVQLYRNNIFYHRNKHIDTHYHNIKELQENGEINVRFVNSIETIVVILMKSLLKVKLFRCVKLISLGK